MECPLCKTQHPLLVRGTVRSPENNELNGDVLDRGYAFCACRNIFYTDWSNMDQRIYDEDYSDRYDGEKISEGYREGTKYYFPIIEKLTDIKKFCEIGSINPTILDEAKKKGWETTRLDICELSVDDEHEDIIGDIESPDVVNKLHDMDVIWMSHLVEHLKDPMGAMDNIRGALAEGGLAVISMPDPYFIDWAKPRDWGHWALREHHIMWDLDSFIEMMEEKGFKCVYSKRHLFERTFQCIREFTAIFQKVGK